MHLFRLVFILGRTVESHNRHCALCGYMHCKEHLRNSYGNWSHYSLSFGSLSLLVGWQEGHLEYKNVLEQYIKDAYFGIQFNPEVVLL